MKITLHEVKRSGQFTCNTSQLNRMCDKIKKNPENVYELIDEYGGIADSVTREKIFQYLTDKYNDGDYEKIFSLWLQRA
jgi:Mg2+/Co2+ transporter CorC